MRFTVGQLRRIFESFEEVPGEGLTYPGFTQVDPLGSALCGRWMEGSLVGGAVPV